MKKVKINKMLCPNAIYIYIGRRPRRRPKIKEKLTYKGRRQRRRPPEKSRKSLHTKGADRGADLLKEKKSKQICRIPLYFLAILWIFNMSHGKGRDRAVTRAVADNSKAM